MIDNNIFKKSRHIGALPVLGVFCFVFFGITNLFAQTAMVTNNFVYYPESPVSNNYQCVIAPANYPSSTDYPGNRSFLTTNVNNGIPTSPNSVDPWVNSALIEFDNVFPDAVTEPLYPNHCLTLCAEVTCSNPVRLIESTNSSGTATVINTIKSGDFPIQTILFDIFKYQAGVNPYNVDDTPPIRTIAMYPAQGSDIDNICKGVPTCCDAPKKKDGLFDYFTIDNPSCNDYPEFEISCCDACDWNTAGNCSPKSGVCESSAYQDQGVCQGTGGFCTWNDSPTCSDGDGSYCSTEYTSTGNCATLGGGGYCQLVGASGTCEFNNSYSCNFADCDSLNTPYCDWEPGTQNCVLTEDFCSSQQTSGACTDGIYSQYCTWTTTSYTCEFITGSCTPGHCSHEEPNPICNYQPGGTCTTATSSPCTPLDGDQCESGNNATFCQWFSTSVTCNTQLTGTAEASSQNTCNDNNSQGQMLPTHPCQGVERFPSKDACKAGITTLHFCTPWDGSYEIDGEFGKSNGQYGYRTTIQTNYPGDGISVTSQLDINHMIVYPGDTQIPIQVDVTNVHSVRSSPTLVGTSPAVISAEYKIRYRLSKDATTSINIIDPYETPGTVGPDGKKYIHRRLVDGQPRDGEGFQGGAQHDMVVTNEDSWDGRDDEGRLLPYGNYLVSIQASTKDEWSGATERDLSRAVTRQLSLDPLKITDIKVNGLSKESTSYAMISYMLTEAATVHLEIYTPGTTFGDLNICSVINTGDCANAIYPSLGSVQLSSANATGLRVASYVEQKARRVSVNNKWDGMCWDVENCGTSTTTLPGTTPTGYAYGGALPDGDYVYLLWAEIPYGSTSGQPGGTFDQSSNIVTVNNVQWDGVKTHMIYNGIMPINRGYPEITIDAVSYSTIGSSPIANGLDPFVISYSLSRDSYVDAGIYTIASSDTYTAGVCESDPSGILPDKCAPYKVKTISENEVKEALTKNTYYWDGLDDLGRYAGPGNYMLRITAKDALFPAKMVTRTIEFPVDMFRLVDVQTTPLLELGSSNSLSGLASISYMLSKSMEVSVKIYDRGVIIPKGGSCEWPPAEYAAANPYCTAEPECCIRYSTETADTGYTDILPIKEFKGTRQGEGYTITDYWDGYKVDAGQTATEMMPDGLYPYIIIASASLPGSQYYSTDTAIVYPLNGAWHPLGAMYASDKVTGYITVSRGPVYFTDINIRPTHPTQYYSSATVELAPYEVEFSVNRISSVTVQIISTVPGACMGPASPAGTICRTLTRTNFVGTSLVDFNVYDADVINTLYWDGKDENGDYVKTANYQVKFTAVPYLSDGVTDPGLNVTVENRNLVVNNFQVFDRYIWDVAQQNKGQGKFAYQISVPMKTAIQIFKPNTRVINLSTGELSNPIRGSGTVQATDTRDVLVKAIVGVRPNLVSLEEIWDGTDYAGQKVPDGIYPFRYVTVLDSYQMNSITGDPVLSYSSQPVSDVVMDWDKYINMSVINVVNGDSWYADIDWKDPKVTMFYPNPLKEEAGFFEVTKVPAPGTMSIKIYNIAGDLVRDGGYECVNAIGTTATLEEINSTYGGIMPDWNYNGYSNPVSTGIDPTLLNSNALGRNSALRCRWDKKNNAGKKVARGLYYAIMTLNPTRGNSKKSQRVIKILIP